jgi:dTDP-4-dehydrorhamnose 3,5-epimerase
MFIPAGFAHGFLVLEDNTIFNYKCSEFYNREFERSLRWNDPQLAINWGTDEVILSPKDAEAPLFSDFISTFK